ncbi:MAG TPA: hypothetical protein VLT47_15680 [Anaeromyxobacteraceae bacterium]|nr:hypothetical protein [Anaeromyxobacteraceae bacterium]
MRTMILVAALALAGCQTVFYGAPKVEKGVAGCRATCDGWGMELAGMVKMGEYSDGCICQVRAAPPRAEVGGSVIPPATGVVMQMQAQTYAHAAAGGAAAQQATGAQRSHMEQFGPRR